MMALRTSANAADVRLKHKLRFKYAKLKAKRVGYGHKPYVMRLHCSTKVLRLLL